jgi:ubiquinone/menaquinone biosynthesis C-methylase UbiE
LDSDLKQRAIDVHHEQAELFRRRYEEAERDPYRSAFTYGRRKVDAILDSVLPANGKGLRLLDSGCGSGHTLHKYSLRGYHCSGVDAAPGMVENAQALNPNLDVRLGDVEQVPFDTESFDYVLSIEVIRYLQDARHAIRECHRVLRPGGTALVTAMPPLSLTGYPLLNRLTGRIQVGKLTRVQQYFHSVSWLERAFKECGFAKVEVKAAFWGPWINMERLAPGALPKLLRAWEKTDDRLAKGSGIKDLSNHLVVVATRE